MGFLATYVTPKVSVQLRSGPAARGRSPVSVAALSNVVASASAPRHTIRSMDVAQQKRAEIVSFPGEDAPGTGKRVLPPLVDEEVGAVRRAEAHRGLSSEEYYAQFPIMARASCPLSTASQIEPVMLEPPQGPGSGSRVYPSAGGLQSFEDELPHQPTDQQMRLKMIRQRHGELA